MDRKISVQEEDVQGGGGGEVFSHYRNDAGLQTYCLQLRIENFL